MTNLEKNQTKKLSSNTILMRKRRGMSDEEARNTPLMCVRKLTIAKVLEIEKEGLSIGKSAYILGVTTQTLCQFIKRHNIEWRGRQPIKTKGFKDVNCPTYKIEQAGRNVGTILARMSRKCMTVEEALSY
jgi:hypothetical protein